MRRMSTAANGRFVIKTFNKISAAGLARFDETKYSIATADSKPEIAHAILLRSHKLTESDVPLMCRAIARCGAGTNNCNVPYSVKTSIVFWSDRLWRSRSCDHSCRGKKNFFFGFFFFNFFFFFFPPLNFFKIIKVNS